jgi:gliding motility-associated-like protein
MKFGLGILALLFYCNWIRAQTCPDNINFSKGNLTHWAAYTGNNGAGNGTNAIKVRYDSTTVQPRGTINATAIDEYNLAGVPGIQIISAHRSDPFGGFATVPNINGYQYTNSVLLGSTSVSIGNASNPGNRGGYIRGISYAINVPASPAGQPYTMTYAYAMVLENGTHNSDEQPLFSATLTTNDSVITCASPKYYLPTSNTAAEGGRGAILDTAAALKAGFRVSPVLSPNPNPLGNGYSNRLQDVWTKGWTEVTFDLTPYRGQKVVLTFEADNCIPGGHFAYAYVALRNDCSGLQISGAPIACTNSVLTYSVPALAGARYRWSVPSDWTITTSPDTSFINVKIGVQPGFIVANEVNSCANLHDTIPVTTTPPTLPGALIGDTTVCAGSNVDPMALTGNRGNVLKWISTADGVNWNDIPNTTQNYTAINLNTTQTFAALVQNGPSCIVDTSGSATVNVDQHSIGGKIDPGLTNICEGQPKSAVLTVNGNLGQIINWQYSLDQVTWTNYNPALADSVNNVSGIVSSTEYRAIAKNGVCPADTSAPASIQLFSAFFPQAAINPPDTTICYGGTASLNATINIGTSYNWSSFDALSNPGNGNIPETPYSLQTQASPLTTIDYILAIKNQGCPNTLYDTFHVKVLAPIIVDAGGDTAVVVNQPLQFNATSSDGPNDAFLWTPATALNNPDISNPVGVYDASIDSVRYRVRATASTGCFGETEVLVKVFKTGPDIFVPNAFTPDKGYNSVFRPIPVGVASLQYFRIFNRWGQLVFSTNRIGQGWDGRVNGQPQGPDSYVWMVQGTAYTGRTIIKKGVMVLIR